MKTVNNMFCKDVNFLQKVVIFHPTNPHKFLALHRSASDSARPSDWDLIGGHVIFGETNQDSIKREAKEEANIEIEKLIPILVAITYQTEKICKLFIGYKGTTPIDKIQISGEHDSYSWVTSSEFKKLTKTQFLLDLVDAAAKGGPLST